MSNITENPVECSDTRASYPTDLSDGEWQRVQPLVMPPTRQGRRRTVDEREVLNAILYLSRSGCAWRMLPHDLPPWPTVYYYFNRWSGDGTLQSVRVALGR